MKRTYYTQYQDITLTSVKVRQNRQKKQTVRYNVTLQCMGLTSCVTCNVCQIFFNFIGKEIESHIYGFVMNVYQH